MSSTGVFAFNIVLYNLFKLKCKDILNFLINEVNHIKSNIIFTAGTGVVKYKVVQTSGK